MRNPEKILVTGRGVLTPLGADCGILWDALLHGQCGIDHLSFDGYNMDDYKSRVAGLIKNFDINTYFEHDKGFKRHGRVTNFALAATKSALDNAGYSFDIIKGDTGKLTYQVQGIDRSRCAIILGIGVHNMDISEKHHTLHVLNHGPKRVSPFALPFIPTNIVPGLVAEKFDITGPSFALSTACASGTHAIVTAYNLLMNDACDMAIVGGVEACVTSYVFGGFDAMRALSRNPDPDKACRPFDKDRDGFVMSEGSGILIFEKESHARKRGAQVLAECAGGAMTSDAFHITIPNPTGTSAINMLQTALKTTRTLPEEIDYINPHGTSTPLNDPNESYIIKQVFGDYAYKIPISSTKSMLGHSIGASGGIEAIVCVQSLLSDMIHPTRNLDNPDVDYVDPYFPDMDKRCDLDYVPGTPRKKRVDVALSESFGFGGQNAAAIFRKVENGA